MATKRTNRSAMLQRAAEFRGRVIAYLSSDPKQHTLKEILELPEVSAMNIEHKYSAQIINRMVKNNLIVNPSRGEYCVVNDESTPTQTPVKFASKTSKARTESHETFAVDLIKSTGKLRIQFRGISVEIGVID